MRLVLNFMREHFPARVSDKGDDKKVVSGVNTQILVAVIGDTSVVTILDARICLPKHTGSGAQPMLKNEWFTQSLERLESKLNQWGLSLNGCHVSLDRLRIRRCAESAENPAFAADFSSCGRVEVGRRGSPGSEIGRQGNPDFEDVVPTESR